MFENKVVNSNVRLSNTHTHTCVFRHLIKYGNYKMYRIIRMSFCSNKYSSTISIIAC